MMIKNLSVLATLLGAGMVSLAYMIAGLFWPAGLIVIVYVIITIMSNKRLDWVHTPSLYLIFGLTVLGLYFNVEFPYLFSGAVISLAGWDLADFSTRIHLSGQEDDLGEVKKRHLIRLGLVIAVGIFIMLVALNLRLSVAFGWVSVIAIISTLGFGWLVSRLLKRE